MSREKISSLGYAWWNNITAPIAKSAMSAATRGLIPVQRLVKEYIDTNVCRYFSVSSHFDAYISKCARHLLAEKYLKPKYGDVLVDVDPSFALCTVSLQRIKKKTTCYPELVNKVIAPGIYSLVMDSDGSRMIIINEPQNDSNNNGMAQVITHYKTHFIFTGKNRDKWHDKVHKELDDDLARIARTNQGNGKIRCKSMSASEADAGVERKTVPMSMLSFPAKDHMINVISRFLQKKEFYEQLGVPHRRGILLSGNPGTGKTMFAFSIAPHFDMECVTVSLDYFDKNPGANAFSQENTVYVIDEIDSQLINRAVSSIEDSKTDQKVYQRRLYHLLMAMDTMDKGSIVVATTNYPQRLDPALKRSGRFDDIVDMNDLDKEFAYKMVAAKNMDPEAVLRNAAFPINPAKLEQMIIYKLMMDEKIGVAKKVASFEELGLANASNENNTEDTKTDNGDVKDNESNVVTDGINPGALPMYTFPKFASKPVSGEDFSGDVLNVIPIEAPSDSEDDDDDDERVTEEHGPESTATVIASDADGEVAVADDED